MRILDRIHNKEYFKDYASRSFEENLQHYHDLVEFQEYQLNMRQAKELSEDEKKHIQTQALAISDYEFTNRVALMEELSEWICNEMKDTIDGVIYLPEGFMLSYLPPDLPQIKPGFFKINSVVFTNETEIPKKINGKNKYEAYVYCVFFDEFVDEDGEHREFCFPLIKDKVPEGFDHKDFAGSIKRLADKRELQKATADADGQTRSNKRRM